MPLSSGSDHLSLAAQAALAHREEFRFRKAEVVQARGVIQNPYMNSGADPTAWNSAPNHYNVSQNGVYRPSLHASAHRVQSGGIFSTWQIGLRINSGEQNSFVRFEPIDLLSSFRSGDAIDWEVTYKIPSGSSMDSSMVLLIKNASEDWEPVHRTSASTMASGTDGWVTKCGRWENVAATFQMNVRLEASGSSPTGAGNYSDPDFLVLIDQLQGNPVIKIPSDRLLTYGYRKSTDFASAAGEVSLANPGGLYSPEKSDRIRYGDQVRIHEAVDLNVNRSVVNDRDLEWHEVFRGSARDFRTKNLSGRSQVQMSLIDPLVKLQDLSISNSWSGEKQLVEEDFFHPSTLEGTPSVISGSVRASVWSVGQTKWASSDLPTLQVQTEFGYPILDSNIPKFDLFPEFGQILFERPLDIKRTIIEARYKYYVEPLHVEDLIEDILCSGDGFGIAPFTRDYNLSSHWSQHRSGTDVLLPNTVTDTIRTKFRVDSAGGLDGDYARCLVNEVDHSLNAPRSFNVVNASSGGVVLSSASYSLDSMSDIDTMSGSFLTMPSGSYVLVASRGILASDWVSGGNLNLFDHLGAHHIDRFYSGSIWQQVGFYESGSYAFIGQVGKLPSSGVIPEVLSPTHRGPSVAIQSVDARYAAGSLWYTRYNRWETSLSLSDLETPAGTVLSSLNSRLGYFILTGTTIGVNSTVRCLTDYQFRTIQATGIGIGEFSASFKDDNRMAVINRLRESVLPPNYILRSEREHIWGSYFNQSTVPDYFPPPSTKISLEQTGDPEVYTRVQVFGKNDFPTNLSIQPDLVILDQAIPITGSVTNSNLIFIENVEGGWKRYSTSISGTGFIFRTPQPQIKVDGQDIYFQGEQQLVHQPVRWRERLSKDQGGGTDFWYWLFLAHGQISPDHVINFFDDEGNLVISLPPNISINDRFIGTAGLMDYEQGVYQVPTWQTSQDAGVDKFSFLDSIPSGTEIFSLKMRSSSKNDNDAGSRFPHEGSIIVLPTDVFRENTNPIQPVQVVNVVKATLIGGGTGAGDAGYWDVEFSPSFFLPQRTLTRKQAKQLDIDWSRARLLGTPPVYGYTNMTAGVAGSKDKRLIDDGAPRGNFSYSLMVNESPLGISTADYVIITDSDDIQILTDRGEFLIRDTVFGRILGDRSKDKGTFDSPESTVDASYHFAIAIPPISPDNASNMLKSSPRAQTQMEYVQEPPPGTVFTTIDLGSLKDIDGIDLVVGYFQPADDSTGLKKFDVGFKLSLTHSIDNVDYFPLAESSLNIDLSTGGNYILNEDELGLDFQTRYIRMTLEHVNRLDYKGGRWPVSISRFTIWQDTMLKGNAKLIDGVIDSDTQVEDLFSLRQVLGDRLFKDPSVRDELSTQELVDLRAVSLLKEFVKNNVRLGGQLTYFPALNPGQTIHIVDDIIGIDRNYFVEKVTNQNSRLRFQLAYFP